MRKTIGVLGGLGPPSSALFHRYLVEQCQVQFGRADEYPHIFIYDFPASDITKCGIDSNATESMLKTIASAISRLETFGIDLLTIPCNTAFVFFHDLCSFTPTPILNIVEEAAKRIQKDRHRRVGILATSPTLHSGIYSKVFNEFDMELIPPNAKQQEQVDLIITKIDQGNAIAGDRALLERIINSLEAESSVTAVIIACTCIPVLLGEYDHKSCSIFDSLLTYAECAIDRILKPAPYFCTRTIGEKKI